MAKARLANTKRKTPVSSKRLRRAVVGKKRFRASSGKYTSVAVLDANTATFGTDLLQVFSDNVARARKENTRLFGSPDRVPDNK